MLEAIKEMLKGFLKKGLARFNYKIIRITPEEKGGLSGAALLDDYKYDDSCSRYLYKPWLSSEFSKLWRQVDTRMVGDHHRAYFLQAMVTYCATLPGDMAECGVYRGGSAYVMSMALSSLNFKNELVLFDTFTGVPAQAITPGEPIKPGKYGDTSLSEVQDYLKEFKFIRIVPGCMPETFQGILDHRFSFVHVDANSYTTTLEICEFFYERLLPGGILLFDEYGELYFRTSEKRACDEFFKDKPEPIIPLSDGTAFVVKASTSIR